MGSNTSVQDAYNLAWKMAYVLRGSAGEGLLDSYDAERAPVVDREVVLRANKSIEEFGPIFEALGLADTRGPGVMRARVVARAENTPEAAEQRAALGKATPPSGPAHGCRTSGLPTDPDTRSAPTTWRARAGSRPSPASPGRHGRAAGWPSAWASSSGPT